MHSNFPYEEKQAEKKLGPIRNAYNVINNQKLPDFYFEKRDMRLPVEKTKKILASHKKEFNIVSNVYTDNHEQKMQKEEVERNEEVTQKYWKTHNFDPVFGKFYDQRKEEEYQKEREEKEKEHGRDAEEKLPPSYVYREPFIADYSKPLPKTLKILDEQKAQAQKKYQVKYMVLDEYQKRNHEEVQKQ